MTLKIHDPAKSLDMNSTLVRGSQPTHRLITPKVLMKNTPNRKAPSVSEILYGETLTILDSEDGWSKIACERDGYVGWVQTESLSECNTKHDTYYYISAPVTHIYRKASLKSDPLQPLYMTSIISITGGEENGFYPVEGGGWVYARHMLSEPALLLNPVDVAQRLIGSAYLWGGRSYEGLDCSGLVQLALFMSGFSVLRDSGMQFSSIGKLLKTGEQPVRGDLAFFPGHVGLMLDNRNILHANATNMAVTADPLEDVISWVAEETDKPPFLGYRRF